MRRVGISPAPAGPEFVPRVRAARYASSCPIAPRVTRLNLLSLATGNYRRTLHLAQNIIL